MQRKLAEAVQIAHDIDIENRRILQVFKDAKDAVYSAVEAINEFKDNPDHDLLEEAVEYLKAVYNDIQKELDSD